MLRLLFALLLSTRPLAAALPDTIDPTSVAIVYNSSDPASQDLALSYAHQRSVPTTNLIGLDLPADGTISRADYDRLIRDPLVKHFDNGSLWSRQADINGTLVPTRNKIRVLLLMKGVPYRIKRTPSPKGPDGKVINPPLGQQDEASVDSELVYLGLSQVNLAGPLNNSYYQKETGIADPALTPLLFTCRIDGVSYETCERIIADSIAVEKTGLWGLCYLDHALKGQNYEIGDDWLRVIARTNRKAGVPTIVERFRDTLPTNYPMTECALYFGWYATNANGPLLNPSFRFKKGAVAVHLHSFSASNLHSPTQNWVGPILEKGAAATVGNVWEPYLTGTHNFDILHDRLMKGYSLVEAAHMAMPAHSWQPVVIGDPLYRPFLVNNQSPALAEEDKAFRAFSLAIAQWSSDPDTLIVKLRTAAARMTSGILYESLGLRRLEENNLEEAKAFFLSAAKIYPGAPDKLRQSLHIIAMHRTMSEKEAALEVIAEAQERFGDIPEAKALVALKNILDPPAPPPAKSEAQ